MKVGSIVFARYPRRDGAGMGIVIEYVKGGQQDFGLIASRAKVYWSVNGEISWVRSWDLEEVCK